VEITHQDIQTNGVTLHVASCGPEDGPLVILLHGFPEYWGAWEAHMHLLADQGFRVIAPDQRGYNTSEKPPRVRDYRLDVLSDDILGLIDHHGQQTARLVGHDWGGAVAWHLARAHAERIHQLVVINCPPADVMQRYALRHPSQLVRSWYMMAMQLPWLAEWTLSMGNFSMAVSVMVDSATPGTFDRERLSGHIDAWSQPGALRGMVNWYRAGFRNPPKQGGGPVKVPTLLLWGERDRFLAKGLVDPAMAICEDGRAVRYPDATHWLPHEATEEVVKQMSAFFRVSAGESSDRLHPPADPSE